MADIQAIHMGLPAAPPDTDTIAFQHHVQQQIFQLKTTKDPSPNIRARLKQAGQLEHLREKVIKACARCPVNHNKYGIELDVLHILPSEDVEMVDLDDD